MTTSIKQLWVHYDISIGIDIMHPQFWFGVLSLDGYRFTLTAFSMDASRSESYHCAEFLTLQVLAMNVVSQQASVGGLREKADNLTEMTRDAQSTADARQLVKKYDSLSETVKVRNAQNVKISKM